MRDARGRCLCGAVRFAFDPAAIAMQSVCHCESCRRAAGAVMVGWIGVRDTGWRWSVGRPRLHASSPGVRWGFCGDCGSLLSYRNEADGDRTDLAAAALVDPSEFRPRRHSHWAERVPWLVLADDLPRHDDDPAD